MANDESNAARNNTKIVPGCNTNLKVPPIKIVLGSNQSNNAVVNLTAIATTSITSSPSNTTPIPSASTSSEEDIFDSSNNKNDCEVSMSLNNSDYRTEKNNKKSSHQHKVVNNDGSASDHKTVEIGVADNKQNRNKHNRQNPNLKSEPSDTGQSTSIVVLRMSSSSDRSSTSTPSSESDSIASNSTIISEQNQQQQQQQQHVPSPDHTHASRQAKATNSSRYNSNSNSISSPPVTSNSNFTNGLDQNRNSRHATRWSTIPGGLSSRKTHNAHTDLSPEGMNDLTSNGQREQAVNVSQRITRSSQRAAQQSKQDSNSEFNHCDDNQLENGEKDSSRKAKRRKVEITQESEQDNSQPPAPPAPPMANICLADYQPPIQNSFQLYKDIRVLPLEKMRKLHNVFPKTPHGFKEYLLFRGPYLLDGNKLGAGMTGSKIAHDKEIVLSKLLASNRLTIPKIGPTTSNNEQESHIISSVNHRYHGYDMPRLSPVPNQLELGPQLYKLFQDHELARYKMRVQHLKERERLILSTEQEVLRSYSRAAVAERRQDRHLSACTFLYYQERYHYSDQAIKTTSKNSSLKLNNDDNQESSSKPVVERNNQISDTEPHTGSVQASANSEIPTTNQKITEKPNSNSGEYVNHLDKSPVDPNQNDEVELVKLNKVDSNDHNSANNDLIDVRSNNQPNSSGIGEIIEQDGSISDESFKLMNKNAFLQQLQDIDEKWERIRNDMMIRHKNEADSLYAIQSMEWEWKARELGLCDVRKQFKVEDELVPRVDVCAYNY